MDKFTEKMVEVLGLPKNTRKAVIVLEAGKLPLVIVHQLVMPQGPYDTMHELVGKFELRQKGEPTTVVPLGPEGL